jgi:hypothetical protein
VEDPRGIDTQIGDTR